MTILFKTIRSVRNGAKIMSVCASECPQPEI
jgi:hypothetical protein